MRQNYHFPAVTLLITHYNRSHSLENLLVRFQNLNCQFGAVVVSDDGSATVHLDTLNDLQRVFSFDLVTTPVNKGLGNNINKGQDAVHTPYTLYVQEDFEPTAAFPDRLVEALGIIKERPDFDVIRFYSYIRYPYLKPFNNEYSEMVFPAWATDYNKVYFYSDHPHLRHSSFFTRFGRYVEGVRPDRTEYQMCISFIRHKGKGLFYNDYKQLFQQKNTEEEPSTYSPGALGLSKSKLVVSLRYLYRQIKFNYDIYVKRMA
ncbi:glycosyltransferase [Spirosoma sp. RP8]|uniref:Glycosyltransferase n=1 Tax=Spirosoma liriopis TaxID=2937440 RepID=A0ABT0HDY9_9BACT|nr:glycosyltransferase [Spirosoma liriopis]MCK8490376.1 glycosyltransferase [Spirosoma liriopis]